jgi:hypothetical protein
VLSFAAVAFHGREWRTRSMSRALLTLLAMTPLAAQPAVSSPQDLVSDLAAKIAAAVAPAATARLTVLGDRGGDPGVIDTQLGADLSAALAARGVVVDESAAVAVDVSCGDNLREHACVAAISRSGSFQLSVAATRARAGERPGAPVPSLSLELQPILAEREIMLDVLTVADRLLLVLSPDAVTLRARESNGQSERSAQSVRIAGSRAWPRDMRGRLRLTPKGFDAFLPGVVCRGTIAPLAAVCADENESWPLGIDNAGISANRNYFTTPEGFAFYGAAPLETAKQARWLVADQNGMLVFLDRQRSPIARGDPADNPGTGGPRVDRVDDVVRLTASCAPSNPSNPSNPANPANLVDYVVAASQTRGGDVLRLMQALGTTLTTTATVGLPGEATALWDQPDGRFATVIVRSPGTSRYEAFRLTVSCAR